MQTSLKTKSEQTPAPQSRDVEQTALERMRIGSDVGERLRVAALAAGDAQAEADADLIIATAHYENFKTVADVPNEFGERFGGLFTLSVLSSSRLCPSYVAKSASKARKRMGDVIQTVEKKRGERWWLVTLTAPTLIGVGLNLSFEIFDNALVRLRKCKWWKDRVPGAIKGEEFTLGDKRRLEKESRAWDFERDGYHVHAHVMALAVEIGWDGLGEEWRKCLLAASHEHGVAMQFNTSHGRPVVDVRLVTSKKRGERTISTQGAIFEVCKYLVKGSEFSKVPASQLLEVERTLRGRRMVELWGALNKRRGSTAGTRGKSKAERTETQPAQAIEQHSGGEPEASGTQLEYVHESELLTVGETRKLLTAKKTRGSPDKLKKRRAEPLRKIGARMIAEGRRAEWKEMIEQVAEARREWRESDLIRRFPFCVFRYVGADEDARKVYGLCVNPSSAFDDSEMYGHRIGFKAYGEDHAAERAEADYRTQSSAECFERKQWSDDATNYRELIRRQEEERWLDYVNYGGEFLTGDETIKARKRRKHELFIAEINKPMEQRADEREFRAARIQQWSIYEATRA